MTTIQILASQPWVERFGMTLLHFLWQGFVIAILYAAARLIAARTSSPQTRYLMACAALGAMLAAPLVTWELMRPLDAIPEAMYRIRSTPATASPAGIATPNTLPDSVRATVSGRAAATALVMGCPDLVRRCDGALGQAGRRLGGCGAHAVDAGPARAAGMAAEPAGTRHTDWSLSSRAIARFRAGTGPDGGRLAAPRGACSGRGARRYAC